MKKIPQFISFSLLALFFSAPLLASATAVNCPPGYISIDCPSPGTPVSSGNASGVNPTILQGYAYSIIGIINGIFVPVLMAIAFIVFLWGVYNYFILGAVEEKSRTDGRQFILWGIVGFVVILSVWGLVAIVGNTFGLSPGGAAPPIPSL